MKNTLEEEKMEKEDKFQDDNYLLNYVVIISMHEDDDLLSP